LLGAALEDKNHAAERRGISQSPLVELGPGKWVGVAGEGGDPSVVDGLQDAGARSR